MNPLLLALMLGLSEPAPCDCASVPLPSPNVITADMVPDNHVPLFTIPMGFVDKDYSFLPPPPPPGCTGRAIGERCSYYFRHRIVPDCTSCVAYWAMQCWPGDRNLVRRTREYLIARRICLNNDDNDTGIRND